MHIFVFFFLIASINSGEMYKRKCLSSYIDFYFSAAINTDFVSPEELEAIRNGEKIPSQKPTLPKVPIGISHEKVPIAPTPLKIKTSDRFDNDDDRPIWGSSSVNSANSQSQVNNKHGGNDLTAGANSYNNNVINEHGAFHNSGASSIGGNISEDGKKAQLAASNSQKTSSQTAGGYTNQETHQSQSTNYDKDQKLLLATDSKTSNKHTIDSDGEKQEQSSGSSATNENQFGSGNAVANTNSVDYFQNGVKGNKKESTAQSTQTNKDGSVSNAHTHSGTNTFEDKDGNKVTESKAGSMSSTQGQNGSSGSSSNCGTQAGQKEQSNGFSSSFSSSSSSSFSNGNGQTFSNSGCETGSKTGALVPLNIQSTFGLSQFSIPHAVQYPFPFIGPFG